MLSATCYFGAIQIDVPHRPKGPRKGVGNSYPLLYPLAEKGCSNFLSANSYPLFYGSNGRLSPNQHGSFTTMVLQEDR